MIELAALPSPEASTRDLLNFLNSDRRTHSLQIYPDLEADPECYTMYLSFGEIGGADQRYHSAHLHCDFGDATLFATAEWLEQLCDIALSGWRDEPRDALKWDVCMAYVLSRLIELTEPDTGFVNISDVRTNVALPADPSLNLLHANVRSGDLTYPLAMVMHHCDFNYACDKLRFGTPMADPAALADPGFVFTMQCRPLSFALGSFRAIQVGAIVTFDRVFDGGCEVHCTVPDLATFNAVFDRNSDLTVSTVHSGDFAMTSDRDATETDAPIASDTAQIETLTSITNLSEIPVSLEFCFPAQRLSLRELSDLTSGSSLKANCALKDRLTIRANGRVVGGGHLVDLDGVLGLRVTDWALQPQDHIPTSAITSAEEPVPAPVQDPAHDPAPAMDSIETD